MVMLRIHSKLLLIGILCNFYQVFCAQSIEIQITNNTDINLKAAVMNLNEKNYILDILLPYETLTTSLFIDKNNRWEASASMPKPSSNIFIPSSIRNSYYIVIQYGNKKEITLKIPEGYTKYTLCKNKDSLEINGIPHTAEIS
jgi:hypothetical protein